MVVREVFEGAPPPLLHSASWPLQTKPLCLDFCIGTLQHSLSDRTWDGLFAAIRVDLLAIPCKRV